MAEITAKLVAELRAKTGCGMMDCKNALKDANGDFEEAVKLLREKGLAVAAKKESRIAAEGIVEVMYSDDKKTAAMIEVNAETDFVAKNDVFKEFVAGLLRTILANKPSDVDALMTLAFDGSDTTVEDALKEKVFTIGEKIKIRRFVIVEGVTSSYIHGKGATGVIVKFDCDDTIAAKEGFAEFAKNIALQVAAYPTQYVDKESVPADVIASEKEILIAQIKNDPANAKKPDAIVEKMVAGRIGKFYEANCLIEQSYIKDDAVTVAKYIEQSEKELGGALTINSFYRFVKGEGIQKREDNFGDEIASMLKK